ncbi:phosphoribosyltransferase [Candidatus Bathyarchaeota archaeon]|nr:MAG: phosphoribosyltransferase [Candidatus Bathyarchaeota archaeon]
MAQVIDSEEYRKKTHVFRDREHAGELLAEKLEAYQGDRSALVVAIPAGGVPVGCVISEKLDLPLEVAVTRKLHVPWNPEAGFGAVAWNGLVEVNQPLVRQLGLTDDQVEEVVEKEKRVIRQRMRLYGRGEFPDIEGRHPILVDDGLASGFSMLTTARAVKQYNPGRVTVAVPTAPLRSIEMLRRHVDEVYCLNVRSGLYFAVASAYIRWRDLTDEEVMGYLKEST